MEIDTMTTTDQDRRAIAFLAKRVRDELHGARNWDEAGIIAALTKVSHLHLADVTLAAVRAADDRSLDTPGPIGNPSSSCWRERHTDRPTPRQPHDRNAICATCSEPEDRCRQLWNGDHEFVTVAEHQAKTTTAAERVAELRALKAGRRITEPEGADQ